MKAYTEGVAARELVPVSLEPDPVIEAYKKDVDVTLLDVTLALTPAQRVERLQAFLETVEELRRAGEAARARGPA